MKRGLCKNEVNRETQRCSYRAPKWKQHLLTPPSGAPGALWVTTTCFHDKNTLLLPLLPEPTAEPSRSENGKGSSLLDQQAKWPKASCTIHFCLAYTCRRATAAPASLGGGRHFIMGSKRHTIAGGGTPLALLRSVSKFTLASQPRWRQQQCFTCHKFQYWWGCMSNKEAFVLSLSVQKEIVNYLPVNKHVGPEVTTWRHHKVPWRVYVYKDIQQPQQIPSENRVTEKHLPSEGLGANEPETLKQDFREGKWTARARQDRLLLEYCHGVYLF